MSTCNKDLIEKCSKSGIISIKSNFHKNKIMSDGFIAQCKFCTKKYNVDNQDRLLKKQKLCDKGNRDKNNTRTKVFLNKSYGKDANFRLIYKTRSRIRQALQRKRKSSSTKNILGIDMDTYKKWLDFQFTPDMNWKNIEIHHVKPICMFDLSKDEELKEAFSWKNTQTLTKHDHQRKGTKFNFIDYQLQFIKAHQFIEINDQEGLNEDLH